MFDWNIAKSAETMFSRWAIKHILKFVLKKKLGQFILGDLDLDQLDVQLGAGTIQLNDLALNVDYINQKLHGSPVIVKEGSIGSLLVKIPWRVKNFQIEVEELELVLVPFVKNDLSPGAETSTPIKDCKQPVNLGSETLEHEMMKDAATSISLDVHEGVKTIAKLVKWLLTSFHVKVKNLIVAYDPCSQNDERGSGSHRALVLRIRETEYGTCVSEDANVSSESQVDSFLGLTRLTNFIRFEGAIIELLQMDDVDNQTQLPCASGTTFDEWFTGSSPSGATTPIFTGEGGGFSGNLKLSIPWKNGSLDIQKVNADISIDPVELRLQPSTIMWILCLWKSLKNVNKDCQDHISSKAANSIYYNSASQFHPSALGSAAITTDWATKSGEIFSMGICPLPSQETPMDALLRGSDVIPNWVPYSTEKTQNGIAEAEPDFGASIDQFFECFDGLRTSQSAVGNSGIWNWTCSVFSAITAASSLASGSLHIPSEQQHAEMNLKATVAGIYVVLSLHDEDSNYSCDFTGNFLNVGQNVHYLGAECQDLLLVLQICPREMKFMATVKHIELDHCYINGNEAAGSGLDNVSNVNSENLLIQHLQAEVQGSLPPFPLSQDQNLEETKSASHSTQYPCHLASMNASESSINPRIIPKDCLVKVKLLKTSGVTHCLFTLRYSHLDGSLKSATSFSVKLPPFIFWVNFNLGSMLLDLLRQVGNSFEMKNKNKDSGAKASGEELGSACHGDVKGATCQCVTTSPPKGNLQGNISLSNTRIILCFPFKNHGDFRCYSSWDQFIVLDISHSQSKENIPDFYSTDANMQRAFSYNASSSIHANFENLNIYLITADHKDVGNDSCTINKQMYCSQEILSVSTRTDHLSAICMLWQDGLVTGPWMAKKARNLATSQDSMSRNKVKGKGYEFASVTTVGDQEDVNSHTRQEMILSSAFFLHIRLSPVSIKLDSSQYQLLHCLLNQVMDWLACLTIDTNTMLGDRLKKDVASASQTSVLVECDSVKISVNLDKMEDITCSIQRELPGSWHSLKLEIQNFELLSVSNIGGISGCNFFWLGHGEGELRGSIDGFPAQELLLISCSNSTMRRGDGEGANALSFGSAGTAIMHLWDPQIFQRFTSVTVRCGTIIAPGGRLDWCNAICNFFSLPCESVKACDASCDKGLSEDSASCRATFVLNLVDIALSYEPHMKNLAVSGRILESEFNSYANLCEERQEQYVACLLAAASLHLSNKTQENSMDNDYKIRVQDLGLLLCAMMGEKTTGGTYDVENLQKTGYIKVAGEALVEAVLRTNCRNGLIWELECSDSHINLDTCHDTTSGLMRLATQLQHLFAPDVQESIVHLQSRWKTVQQAHNGHCNSNETNISDDVSASSPSCMHLSSQDATSSSICGAVGLMDEICENAFHFNGSGTGPSDRCDMQSHISCAGGLTGGAHNLNIITPEYFSHSVSSDGSMPGIGLKNCQASSLQKDFFPELIEGYYISGLCPLSEKSARNPSFNTDLKCKSRNERHGDVAGGNSGWYQGTSLKIVENHIPEVSEQHGGKEFPGKCELPSTNCTEPDEFCNARGRVLLKNIDVRWRMYAGSDWYESRENVQLSANTGGRDTTVCLELSLSGMDLQYDLFPDGEICVSKLTFSAQDFHLYDYSKDAPWKLVVGYYHSKDHPRESSAKAIKLDLEAVRPDPSTPLEEYRLRLAFLPILLHLDQDQLDFLVSFFGEKSSSVDQIPSLSQDLDGSRVSPKSSSDFGGHAIAEEALLPFFQKFDIWPAVVRMDYIPRRVDLAALRGGNYVHLVNLVPWKGVELQLKHVHAVGIYGWSSICETIVGEWLEDISNNQIHKFLKGLPPIRSLFTVGSGAAKLVSLPVKNYRKDNRLLKGIQRGAVAFFRSISLEAVGLGVHLAAGAHEILLQTEYTLTSIPRSVPSAVRSKTKTNVKTNQPEDAQQGIQQAYESLTDGLGKTASALVGTPFKTYQRGGGAGSALASAVCGAPAASIAPATAAVHACYCTLLGIRNSLDPEHKKESMDKYLGPTQPQEHS